MPQSITPLLAERLDVSTDRAETLLQSMLQELKSRAASEDVRLPELGIIREQDGTLTFVPSPSLRRRVNHQFEGLSPEDLSGPPEADEAASPTLDPVEEDGDGDTTESADQPVDPGPGASSEEPVGPEPASSGEPEASTESSIPTLDPVGDEDGSDEGDVPPQNVANEPAAVDEPPAEEERELVSPTGSFALIGGLLTLVALVGVGWFVLSETTLWSPGPSGYDEPETSQSATAEEPAPSSDPTTSDGASGTDQPERHAGVPPGEGSASRANAGTGPWTVIVASFRSRTSAEKTAAEYEDQFAHAEIVPTTTDNSTRYRVAVGRYDSEASAERAREQNASMMPPDAWLHELR
jgi:hypothetical protein